MWKVNFPEPENKEYLLVDIHRKQSITKVINQIQSRLGKVENPDNTNN